MDAFGLNFCHGLGLGLARAAAGLAARTRSKEPIELEGRHGVRRRDLLPGDRRLLRGAHRGGGDPHADGAEGDIAISARRNCRSQIHTRKRRHETRMDRNRPDGLRDGRAPRQEWRADVTVWNRTRAKAEPLAAHGAKVADSLPELAACDIVFVMVSTWDDVKEVIAGAERVAGGRQGAQARRRVLVDFRRRVDRIARAACEGAASNSLAAPVSGNAKVIKAGRLSFVCSGPQRRLLMQRCPI